jgi:hypothetical protein
MNCYGAIVPIFVLVFAIATWADAQSEIHSEQGPSAAMRDELVRSFQNESKRGANLFYTQVYKVRGRRVEFDGSIFGAIEGVEVDGCVLSIKSEIVDRYAGTIGNNQTGRTQSKYISSIRFKLTTQMAADLKVVTARPVRQLSAESNPKCSDSPNCNLTWIKLKPTGRIIHLTEITNDVADYDGDVQDFDGVVDQFFLPVSSADAGRELIAKMRTFAQSCAL